MMQILYQWKWDHDNVWHHLPEGFNAYEKVGTISWDLELKPTAIVHTDVTTVEVETIMRLNGEELSRHVQSRHKCNVCGET